MGTIAPDFEARCSEVYSSFGLIESAKVSKNHPRVLSILSLLLERSVHKNEKLLETTQKKDSVTMLITSSSTQAAASCFVVAYNVHFTSLNVYLLVITSLMVAAKFIDDV
ncbi:cyclin-P3-1-like [Macadamia integrifolia]|uniref:cyclin-P3-1-like n=1 Tax=Macadamia integrifolia TaxID=60698 RepID=UPI001C4FC9C5|nr:cyclin-P3-1-like [Macadamia integrifolia]